MIKIGITGGIGSGKTTVCKVFELLGVPVYYADSEAKQILDSNLEVKKSIINTFGNDVLNEVEKIDKKKLASMVFNNKENLEKLNSIVHPAVREHFENWLLQHSTQKYILKEAAILFESGSYKLVDKVIAVVAPLELKISRTMQRDKVNQVEVELRISNQLNDDEKIKRSQFVIHNDEQQLLIPQILNIHGQITKL
ncbi:MAG: dephospho-CoA kinase [Bacteroidetes bacterium]|nr:dephospho-CoA kinase [Bacteroidota bacterium]